MMSVVHTVPFRIVVGSGETGDFHTLSTNGRGYLSALVVYSPDVVSFDVGLYNRAFSGPDVDVKSLTEATSGNVLIETNSEHGLQAGDLLTLAGVHIDYNGDSLYVVAVPSTRMIELALTHTVDATDGTVALNILSDYQPLWEVISPGSASSGYFRFGVSDSYSWTPAYKNRDADGPTGTVKKLYISFNQEGTYFGTLTTVGATV